MLSNGNEIWNTWYLHHIYLNYDSLNIKFNSSAIKNPYEVNFVTYYSPRIHIITYISSLATKTINERRVKQFYVFSFGVHSLLKKLVKKYYG